MDSLIRIYKQPAGDPSTKRWSAELLDTSGNLFLKLCQTKSPEGWTENLYLTIRNHTGDQQRIEVPVSSFANNLFPVIPYIQFRRKPGRMFWKIPPFIFQTWKSNTVSPEMAEALGSFKSQEGYTHVFWTDEYCYAFLLKEFGERYANAYKILVPGAYRADFWRYCILLKFGGVYSDAKSTLLRPLNEIIRPDDELVIVKDVPGTCILNGFIACIPNHPMLKIVIDMMLDRIEKRDYGVDALDVTGPHLFGRAFARWKGLPEDKVNLEMGLTPTMQFLGRSECKKYIISPEGEPLLQKEYDSYYNKDVDVRLHYPQLWLLKAIYFDQGPWASKNEQKETPPKG